MRALRFTGNRAFTDAELARVVVTTPSSFLSGLGLGVRRCLDPDEFPRDVLRLVESELAEGLARDQEVDQLPPAPNARLSRRSRAFPLPPKVDLRPDERGRRFLLSVTATDRTGLLYDVARVLARHGIDVRGARVMTLGERAEDTFTIEGKRLGQERVRVQLERELLETL